MNVKIDFISTKIKQIQMKKYLLLFVLSLFTTVVLAQENEKPLSDVKNIKKAEQIENVKQLIDNESFTFNSINAIAKDNSVITLTNYFMVRIEDGHIYSYLPYYSQTFENELKIDDSPFYFKNRITKTELEKEKNYYKLKVETKYDGVRYYFSFRILKRGHTTLHVANSNRQCITFKGMIANTEELQAAK